MDDFAIWPQFHTAPTCHYSIIRTKPSSPSARNAQWWAPLPRDKFQLSTVNQDPARRVGKVDGPWLHVTYSIDIQMLCSRVREFMGSQASISNKAKIQESIGNLSTRLEFTYERLEHLLMSFESAAGTLSRLQHQFLELKAGLDWFEHYKPKWNDKNTSQEVPRKHVQGVMGTFLMGPAIDIYAEFLYALSIPYWVVRPLRDLPQIRIDSIGFPYFVNDRIGLHTPKATTPLLRCPFHDHTKFERISAYFNSRLGCSNPFAYETYLSPHESNPSASVSAASSSNQVSVPAPSASMSHSSLIIRPLKSGGKGPKGGHKPCKRVLILSADVFQVLT